MDKTKISSSALRKRKMMLVVPVLIIPFVTLAFWALGGGKENGINNSEVKKGSGLDLNLPDPKFKKESVLDKLGFYDQAEEDSMKLKEEMRNDPYYREKLDSQNSASGDDLETIAEKDADRYHQSSMADKLNTSPYNTGSDQAEQKLMQKLAELNNAINKPQTNTVNENDYADEDENLRDDSKLNGSVSHLEKMMQAMSQSDDSDPELTKLSSMMDKIIKIQHPERSKENAMQDKQQRDSNFFTVSSHPDADTTVNGFYSLDAGIDTTNTNAIEAVVNETQTLVNGAVIKLRLVRDIYLKNVKIPAGNFVFGIVSLNGQRLEVQINSIRSGNSIYPVKLEVYDMDGLPGVNISGAIGRDVVKQSADNSLQTMQLTSLDPSLTAQAIAAGTGTIKNLISKKVKLVKVTVKAGYRLLLKNRETQK